MHLKEANSRLKSPITESQLEEIDCLYNLLNIDKDVFCKIVDAVGIEVLAEQRQRYEQMAYGARRERKRLHSLVVKKKVTFHVDDGNEMVIEPRTMEVLLNPMEGFEMCLASLDIRVHQEDDEYTVLEPYIEEGVELWRRTKKKIVVERVRHVEVSEPVTTDISKFIVQQGG